MTVAKQVLDETSLPPPLAVPAESGLSDLPLPNGLRATRVSASYPSRDGHLEVFRDVTLAIPRGTTLGIFGPNGTGKTTLLRGLAGLLPIQGTLVYPEIENGPGLTIGCVPQGFATSFYPWASLETNLLLHLPNPIKRVRQNRETIRETHDLLGLNLDLSRRPLECSGGMLQQAALVRALARHPDILVADEPFSALDFDVAGRVREGFSKFVRERGICALLVLHDIEDLLEVCDSVLAIPGRPYTTNPQLTGYARAKVFANHIKRRGFGHGQASAATLSPFVTAIEKALQGGPSV